MKRSEIVECKECYGTGKERCEFCLLLPYGVCKGCINCLDCSNCGGSGYEPVIEDIRIEIHKTFVFERLFYRAGHDVSCAIFRCAIEGKETKWIDAPSKNGKVEIIECGECYHGSLICTDCEKNEICDGTLPCPKCLKCKNIKTSIEVLRDDKGWFFRVRKDVV